MCTCKAYTRTNRCCLHEYVQDLLAYVLGEKDSSTQVEYSGLEQPIPRLQDAPVVDDEAEEDSEEPAAKRVRPSTDGYVLCSCAHVCVLRVSCVLTCTRRGPLRS